MSSELLKLLKPGELLKLRIDALPHLKTREYVCQSLEIDNSIFLMHKNGYYGLHVKVEDINWDAYQKNKINGEEIRPRYLMERFDMRRHPRFLSNLPIEYLQGEPDLHRAGYTLNISENGLMGYLPEKLDIGQNLHLTLFLSFGPDIDSIETLSQVVWRDDLGKGGSFRAGLKFIDITPENRTRLRAFLNHLSC